MAACGGDRNDPPYPGIRTTPRVLPSRGAPSSLELEEANSGYK